MLYLDMMDSVVFSMVIAFSRQNVSAATCSPILQSVKSLLKPTANVNIGDLQVKALFHSVSTENL